MPYIGVSYYDRYAVPLVGVKVLLVIWETDRMLSFVRGYLLDYEPARPEVEEIELAELVPEPITHSIAVPGAPDPDLQRDLPASHLAGPALVSRRGRLATIVLLAAGTGLLGSGVTRAADGPTWPFEYSYDFRQGPLPPELTLFNADEGRFFRSEPEGLRITIPKTWTHPWGGVGFRTSFGFGGDFEVTTAFEVLQAETPPSGYGVGVCFAVAIPNGLAGISRLVRANGVPILLCDEAIPVPGKKEPKRAEKVTPCNDTSGRLRLKRTGSTLSYWWAPGTAGDNFQEIHHIEFGDADIERVRLVGVTGMKPCQLDLRLLDFQVRSQRSDLAGVVPSASTGKASRSGWKVGLAIAVALTLSLGVWLAVRRNRRGRDLSAGSVAADE